MRRARGAKEVQSFLSLVSVDQYAPRSTEISYIAFKQDEHWQLYAARAFVRNTTLDTSPIHFETSSIRAGRFSLSEFDGSISALIEKCLDGVFWTPNGEVQVFADSYTPSVRLNSFHPAGGQSRISVLTIAAQLHRNLQFDPDIKLELNTSDTPGTSNNCFSNW